MAQCITPFYKKEAPLLPLPCGKCPTCVARRVSGWSYRLVKEGELHSLSYFVTLTYSTSHVPITAKGYMSLRKRDIQLFLKRLRKIKYNAGDKSPTKYYCAGEYGTHGARPHYHIILFGCQQQDIITAWTDPETKTPIGEIHFGKVEAASIGYSLKYISKATRVPEHKNDDRQPESSLMSKNLGQITLPPDQYLGIEVSSMTGFICP